MRAFKKFDRELRKIILHRSNSSSKLIMFQIKMANLDDNSSLTSSPETLSEITGTAIVNSFTTESVTKKRIKRSKVKKFSSCSAIDRAKNFNNPNFYADGEVLFCRICSKTVDHRREASLKRHLATSSLHQKNLKKRNFLSIQQYPFG